MNYEAPIVGQQEPWHEQLFRRWGEYCWAMFEISMITLFFLAAVTLIVRLCERFPSLWFIELVCSILWNSMYNIALNLAYLAMLITLPYVVLSRSSIQPFQTSLGNSSANSSLQPVTQTVHIVNNSLPA